MPPLQRVMVYSWRADYGKKSPEEIETTSQAESRTLTEDDQKVLEVLIRGHATLGEVVRNGDMKTAEHLIGQIFDRAFPAS